MIIEGIIVLLSGFLGLVLGALSVYAYIRFKKRKRTQTTKKKKFKKEKSADKGTELLNQKIREKNITMIDFNCAADGIDSTDYIRKRQSHEDEAYNILKSKKEKTTIK